MGKGGDAERKQPAAPLQAPKMPSADKPADAEKESRFMATLQEMVGGAELTEETMRSAIASLSPAQRRKLLSEGRDLKRDLLTKQEHTEDRNLYFKEVNRSADQADLPVDKDGSYLAKKVRHAAA